MCNLISLCKGDPVIVPKNEQNKQIDNLVDYLGARLASSNSEVREFAVVALGKTKHPLALPFLLRALKDKERLVSIAAMWGIAELSESIDSKSHPLKQLETFAHSDPDKAKQWWARKALEKIKRSSSEIINNDAKETLAEKDKDETVIIGPDCALAQEGMSPEVRRALMLSTEQHPLESLELGPDPDE